MKQTNIMKRIINISFVGIFAVLAAVSCQKTEIDTEIQKTTDPTAGEIRAELPDMAKTGISQLDGVFKVVWIKGDCIKVFGSSKPAGEIYQTQSDLSASGTFNPIDGASSVSDKQRYAVYPATAVAGSMSANKVDISFAGLAVQSISRDLAGASSQVATLPLTAHSDDDEFEFTNVCGGIELKIADYQESGLRIKSVKMTAKGGEQIAGIASVDLLTGTATLATTGSANSVTVDCGEGANITNGGDLAATSGILVFLPAGTYSNGFDFEITDTDGRVMLLSAPKELTISSGVVTPLKPLPLTIYYGNVNSMRVVPDAAATCELDITPYYTFSFPYVHEGKAAVNASGAAVKAATKATVLWEMAPGENPGDADQNSGVIDGMPSISGNKLTVKTTGLAGNAVVAITDDADVVLWSYHIWVGKACDVAYVSEGYLGGATFYVMDRNLGATTATAADQRSYGNFYQWGRKDPFPRPTNLSGNGEYTLLKNVPADTETGTIDYAVKHPDTRLTHATSWHTAGRLNSLWGAASSVSSASTILDCDPSVKTVYDPCPAGYRVCDGGALNGLVNKQQGAFSSLKGLEFPTGAGETTYYPAAGILDKAASSVTNFHEKGYLWLSEGGGTGAWTFAITNAPKSVITGVNRPSGIPVRCQKISE